METTGKTGMYDAGGMMPLDGMLAALFRGFAPVTDYETDARDCANLFEPLKDEEDEP